jgi:hypothetical protein
MHRLTALTAGLLALVTSIAHAEGTDDPRDRPPVYVDGARVVDIRDTDGGITRHYSIPSNSVFRTEGDGGPCSFVASDSGTTSTGVRYAAGQRVVSDRWLFIEGTLPSFGEPSPEDPGSTGPLDQAVRHFLVFCDTVYHLLGAIEVGSGDPMIDPRSRLDEMEQALRLVRPVVFENPVVSRWGGLITRYPSWLAVLPPSWRSQRSTVLEWRGWTLYLLARPVALDFGVTFRPDPDRPSTPYAGAVPCVARGTLPALDGVSVPAMPVLPDLARPGVNGACTFTPPGPGTLTVQARITYEVTFWANSYTEGQPDYLFTSLPATFTTGELAAVNVVDRIP